jgi:ABC-2 type transport system permease protein
MNMFWHELKAYRKSTIIWTCSLIALVGLFLAMYPAITGEADAFKKMMGSFPPALRKAIGFSVESVTSLLGFYSYIFFFVILCGGIQAMNLGTSIVSKEVRDKTADFLMTKPVKRTAILTAKLSAALTSLVITNIIYLAVACTGAAMVTKTDFSMKVFIMVSLTMFFLQLIFLALGVILSVIIPKIRSVLSVSLSTVFGLFIVAMISSAGEEDFLRYITPFKYFDTNYIIKNSAYETRFLLLGAGVVLVAVAASYWIYSKKDIHAV